MPLGQTSPTHIFLIKDQEKKTRQHLHREDLKTPTELGLREGSKGLWNRGNAPHREVPHHPKSGLLATQTRRRGCTGTFKPDGAHRCEAPLLKVGHHGLDNKNL